MSLISLDMNKSQTLAIAVVGVLVGSSQIDDVDFALGGICKRGLDGQRIARKIARNAKQMAG